MAVVPYKRPNIIVRAARRLGEAYGVVPQRAAWVEEGAWQHHNLLAGATNAAQRRSFTTNADLSATYGAVFSCIRLRSRMVRRPRIYIVRMNRGGEPEEIGDHPALDCVHNMNEAMTEKQGREYIEQLLLTWGKAYLIKRRNGLGVPVEFEFWPPDEVTVIPDKKRTWAPAAFKRLRPDGSSETVDPKDVLWLRHFLDPRNPLNGLSPIGAVRVQIETGAEAQRYNQRFFDNDTAPSRMFTVEEGGPAEVARIEQELERKFKGTDNAHRSMVIEGGVKVVEGSAAMPHKDMQFLEQMRWTKEETAGVFELSPISLGATEGTTFSNVEWIDRKDWNVIVDQMESVLAQFTEFMLWPDFDRSLEFRADFSMIPALQDDRKLQAEVDDIRLKGGVIIINEIRERDGLEPVAWGDTPVVQNTLEPLDMRTAEEKDAAAATVLAATSKASANTQSGSDVPSDKDKKPRAREIDGADLPETVDQAQERMAGAWERRLRKQLRAFISHLEDADARATRAIRKEDVLNYDWDWRDDFGKDVAAEITVSYEASLNAADFIATPILPTHELAVRYAQARAGELLSENGRFSIPAGTRDRVADLVAKAIADGDSMRALKNALRNDNAFSASRAETIARTETSAANNRASLQAYTSRGVEGKRWMTSGFDVDNGQIGPCVENEAAGVIRLGDTFPSGDDAPPAHPRCRCTIVPEFEMPRALRKVRKKGTLDGREIDIIEEEIA